MSARLDTIKLPNIRPTISQKAWKISSGRFRPLKGLSPSIVVVDQMKPRMYNSNAPSSSPLMKECAAASSNQLAPCDFPREPMENHRQQPQWFSQQMTQNCFAIVAVIRKASLHFEVSMRLLSLSNMRS